MLDFISTLIKEELIEPNWYYQNASQKTSTAGKIGIEWYTGELSETTQAYYTRNNIIDPATGEVYNTKDWWETYPVPKDPASPYGGYQPSDGFLGTIITVSVKAANDAEKMQKIIKFLDDLGGWALRTASISRRLKIPLRCISIPAMKQKERSGPIARNTPVLGIGECFSAPPTTA